MTASVLELVPHVCWPSFQFVNYLLISSSFLNWFLSGGFYFGMVDAYLVNYLPFLPISSPLSVSLSGTSFIDHAISAPLVVIAMALRPELRLL